METVAHIVDFYKDHTNAIFIVIAVGLVILVATYLKDAAASKQAQKSADSDKKPE